MDAVHSVLSAHGCKKLHPSLNKEGYEKGTGCSYIRALTLLQPQGDSEQELSRIKFAQFNLLDKCIILLFFTRIQKFMLRYRAVGSWAKNIEK